MKSPGRNDPCYCGSGKKYKKCCLRSSLQHVDPEERNKNNLKIAHQKMLSGDLNGAEIAFRQVLIKEKNLVEALVGLGQCLSQQWRRGAATPYLLRAGKILLDQAKKSRDVRSLLDFAYLLINLHEPLRAVPFIEGALAIDPNFPRGHHTRALALQRSNPVEAYLSAKKTVELAPGESNAVILLAVLEAKQGSLHEAKRLLEDLVSSGGESFDLPRALLELGNILDRLGRYKQAFSCFRRSGILNMQKPEVQRIDKKTVYTDLEHSRIVFDPEYMRTCAGRVDANQDSPKLVFLIGFYRSGTTLMEQILGAHQGVLTSNEAYIIPEVAREIGRVSSVSGSLQEKIKLLTDKQISHLRNHYWKTAELLMDQSLSCKVFVDKTTMNTLNLGLINTLFPDALVIFAVRDPRDVCLSCCMQSFGMSPLTVHFLDWVACVKFYGLVMEYWLSIRVDLAMPWVELRYEDVLDDVKGQFLPVFDRLGLAWSKECENFFSHARKKTIMTPSFDQVTRPLYRTSMQRWRNYLVDIAEELEYLSPYIRQFGYQLE